MYAMLDNLVTHRRTDVLLFALWHPRWEFVFQPVYAAYLNLIEPWWKVLKSLALKGRRFTTWEEVDAGGRGGHGVLEWAPAPLHLGPAEAAPARSGAGIAAVPASGDLPDAPYIAHFST